jgi:hypothetical protein
MAIAEVDRYSLQHEVEEEVDGKLIDARRLGGPWLAFLS